MGGKTTTMLDVGLFESGDGVLGAVERRKNIQLVVPALERIVRFVAPVLQHDEGFGEVPDFRWEALHRLPMPAGIPGLYHAPGRGTPDAMPRYGFRR